MTKTTPGMKRHLDSGKFSVSVMALLITFLPVIVNAQFANEVKLMASDGAADDLFGLSVSISGDTVIAGATGDDDNGLDSGSAYVFVRDPATGAWAEQQKLTASDGAPGDSFGKSVSISSDTAIVGANRDDDGGDNSGSAYIFVRDPATGAWTEQQKLFPAGATGTNDDNFGFSVSISGDTAIAGATGDDDNGIQAGTAYVFVRNPATGVWTRQPKLLASDGTAGDAFGISVSISGDTVIAGAHQHDDNGSDSGAAYVFVRDPATGAWTEQQKLTASDGAANDLFGLSVSLGGDTAIVAAQRDDDNGVDSGSAYVFVRDLATGAWTEQQKLLASDGAAQDNFGRFVSVSGDTVIAGATGDDDNGANSGSAYIFVRDPATGAWTEQPKLLASDGTAGDAFGISVSISGDTAIAGAGLDNDNGSASGSAYVYRSSVVAAPDITVTDSIVPAGDLSVPYGDVTVSTTSSQTVTITNEGNADLAIGDIGVVDPLAAPFSILNDSCTGQILTPAANCIFDVRFSPTTTGFSSDSFDLPSNDPDENPVTVNVSGTGTPTPVPDITVTDSVAPDNDLDMPFGNVTENTTSDQTVTVTNDGSADLILGQVAGADQLAAPFSVENDLCSIQTLVPAASCTFMVRFAPTVAGPFTDSLDIPSDDPDENTVTVTVAGTATPPVPDITVTDSVAPNNDLQVPFGNVTEGTSSDQTVTVTNDGSADLVLGNVAAANPLAAPFSIVPGGQDTCSGQTLVPAANCTFDIRFSPAAPGVSNDSFDIPSNDPDEDPVTVNVSGTGTPIPVPDITVTDAAAPVDDLQVPFGNVTEMTTADQIVTVTNDGNADLVIGGVAAANPLAAPFSVPNDTCSNQTLAPAAGCTVTVRFAPTGTGPFNDSLDIPSNDPDENPVVVTVSGTGTLAPVPDITVTDAIAPVDDLQLPFADLTVGGLSDQTITVTNDGTADLVLGNIATADPLADPFSVVSDTCSLLAPAASCTVTIRFAPTAAGTFNDSLDIPSDDADENPVTVNVSGTGLAGVNNPPSSPKLVSPADGQQGLPTTVVFRWQPATDPDGDVVSYDLHNCQDADPVANCTSVRTVMLNSGAAESPYRYASLGYGGGVLILGMILVGGMFVRRKVSLMLGTFILSFTLVASCLHDDDPVDNNESFTIVGLDTGSTYYWVVVAKDSNGGATSSAVWRYSTQ